MRRILLATLIVVMCWGCGWAAKDTDPAISKAQWIADQVQWSEQLVGRVAELNSKEMQMLLAENAHKWQRLQNGGPWE